MLTTKEKRESFGADREAISLTETYAIRPYVMRVPNRSALGTSFMTEKAEYHLVSLPLLSIQARAA